ncbi:YjcZ family sporulation protein [Bacillus solimangrovi]|nr:YjcZ family sporulation protein [Bacillus solimangrovi]
MCGCGCGRQPGYGYGPVAGAEYSARSGFVLIIILFILLIIVGAVCFT